MQQSWSTAESKRKKERKRTYTTYHNHREKCFAHAFQSLLVLCKFFFLFVFVSSALSLRVFSAHCETCHDQQHLSWRRHWLVLNIRLLNATNLTTYADWVFLGNNMRIYFKEQNYLLSVREFRYSSSRSNRISKFLYPSCRWDCAEREGTCPQRFDLLRGSTSLKETFAPNGYWPTGTIVFFTVVLSVFFFRHPTQCCRPDIHTGWLPSLSSPIFLFALSHTQTHTRVSGRAPSWFFKATYQPHNKYSGFCTVCMGIREVGNKSGMVLFSSWDAMFCLWNGITLRLYFISDHIFFFNLCLSGTVLCLWCTAGRQAQGVPREWTRCKAGTS